MTTEGLIPHKVHPWFGFPMPIKLSVPKDGAPKSVIQAPLRRGQSLIFALPGGGEFVDAVL
ncbi:hypothetical protein [Ferribacterium limneticum]|uniref:hypothetical protein n=1 Tax=Ferribacterium limneticum TaxID=76259 RepID=UPI001CF7F391|nr:hypothetical protein [Ferribacterium limneticum]UCV26720.1 hypothetical protein KI617_10405 [Ferribacterium limneticum]UCV30637.1 hypothetical protein KI608_10405 [Ferribacterium limneticum]